MAFKDFREVAKKYNIGQGGDWMQLQDGDNYVRIVSDFEPFRNHFDERSKRGMICIGKEKGCPGCALELQASVKCLGWVIDRADGNIKLLRMPYSVFKAIGELQTTPDYEFSTLPDYDINIKRIVTKTAGGEKTSYQVIAARKNTMLTNSEVEQIAKKCKNPNQILDAMKSKQAPFKPVAQPVVEVEENDIPIIDEEPMIDPDNIPF